MGNITIIVTSIIPDEKGKILLVKRANKAFHNTWGLPGGKVKYKERIGEANAREHKEELGIELLNSVLVNYFEFFEPDHAIVFCFEAKINDKIVSCNEEIIGYQWFFFDEIIKKKLAPNHIDVIKYYFEIFKQKQ